MFLKLGWSHFVRVGLDRGSVCQYALLVIEDEQDEHAEGDSGEVEPAGESLGFHANEHLLNLRQKSTHIYYIQAIHIYSFLLGLFLGAPYVWAIHIVEEQSTEKGS